MPCVDLAKRGTLITCVSMGNPHAVIFVEEVREVDLATLWVLCFENYEKFPNRINTEFAKKIIDEANLKNALLWNGEVGRHLPVEQGACARRSG